MKRDTWCSDWKSRTVEDRLSKDDALTVAFALPLALDAVLADRSLLATLDAPLSASETAGFGPFPGKLGLERGFGRAVVGMDWNCASVVVLLWHARRGHWGRSREVSCYIERMARSGIPWSRGCR